MFIDIKSIRVAALAFQPSPKRLIEQIHLNLNQCSGLHWPHNGSHFTRNYNLTLLCRLEIYFVASYTACVNKVLLD